MGVHTGDSVTVAPVQTLTDKQYQAMRDAAISMMRSIGTFAGGCNVQFAVEPEDRPDDRHRDQPARVALVGARIQGHRVSHREGSRPARRRIHARRVEERRHRHHLAPASSRRSTTS
jgi:hypothetical protein